MTLHYEFPSDVTLSEVRDVIEGNDNFIIAERPGYTVVNYVKAGNDTFPPVTDRKTAILRELRGIIFGPDGNIISRRFHKFFNVGEREDMLDLDPNHDPVVYRKLDGSMITPVMIEGKLRWCTKMGITDVGLQAEEFVHKTDGRYIELAYGMIGINHTPIFEWCSRKQRIVIDYPEDKLVLLAIRSNETGLYADRQTLEVWSEHYKVPLVPFEHEDNVRGRTDIEGVVVTYSNGHMVKIKADQYVSLHRAKSLLDNERDVTGLVVEDKVDDLLPLLPEHDQKRLRDYHRQVWKDIRAFVAWINCKITVIDQHGWDRKTFSLEHGKEVEPLTRSFIFKHWGWTIDHKPVVEYILKHLGSARSFEKVKSEILTVANWKEITE